MPAATSAGWRAYWTARTLAATNGWEFNWLLVEAPGIGHDHTAMFEHERCAQALAVGEAQDRKR